METRKYPLTDEMKELTSDALSELALRLESETDTFVRLNTRDSILRASELVERAAELRQASDYFLML